MQWQRQRLHICRVSDVAKTPQKACYLVYNQREGLQCTTCSKVLMWHS